MRRNLSLKWRGADGQEYHLGGVSLVGTVSTEYCNWSPDAIGRLDLSHAYLADVAGLVSGGKIRQTAKPMGWRVVTDKGDPHLADLLDQHTAWVAAITKFTDAIGEALRARDAE